MIYLGVRPLLTLQDFRNMHDEAFIVWINYQWKCLVCSQEGCYLLVGMAKDQPGGEFEVCYIL